MSSADLKKAWHSALDRAADAHSLAHGSGWVAVEDGDAFASSISIPQPAKGGVQTASWSMQAKPLSLDPLLWRALHWESEAGNAAKQTRIRVIGPFSVDSVLVAYEAPTISTGELDVAAEHAVDSLVAAAAEYRTSTPDVAAYLDRLNQIRADRGIPFLFSVGRTMASIALGDHATARTLIDEGLADGSGFTVGGTTLWQLLDADLKAGTGVFA
jgi:hypothetical protein